MAENWTPTFACIVCHARVAKLREDGHPEFNGGTSWQGAGDYGSRALDAEGPLELYVCDVCLLLNQRLVQERARGVVAHDPPVYRPWEPGAEAKWVFEEYLRVYRGADGKFFVRGRLGDAEEVADLNNLGNGGTIMGALKATFDRHEAMIAERDEWRRSRPAIFVPRDPSKWHLAPGETITALYFVPRPVCEGGRATLRVEEVLDDGCYRGRVRLAIPQEQFGAWAVPGAEFQFGSGTDSSVAWGGIATIQEERPEDVW